MPRVENIVYAEEATDEVKEALQEGHCGSHESGAYNEKQDLDPHEYLKEQNERAECALGILDLLRWHFSTVGVDVVRFVVADQLEQEQLNQQKNELFTVQRHRRIPRTPIHSRFWNSHF